MNRNESDRQCGGEGEMDREREREREIGGHGFRLGFCELASCQPSGDGCLDMYVWTYISETARMV